LETDDLDIRYSGGTDMRKNHNLSQTFGTLRLAAIVIGIGFCVSTAAFAANEEQSCAATPEIRQLDYWLGNWTMGSGADKSSSKVSLSLDKCVFLEHWQNASGHFAEKTFAYSAEEKNWYGIFVDNQGRVHIFLNGKVSPDMAEFRGTSRGPNGEAVLNRLKVVRVSADKLEEVWEKSTDNGTNWTTAYRAQYSRANP
jgi:hypothetical protein